MAHASFAKYNVIIMYEQVVDASTARRWPA